ncbi:MAG: CheY-like chemotaxis protein [Candidatus Azotimanducaceae bacterium]|jgi:CheY-like chemotaxis protein
MTSRMFLWLQRPHLKTFAKDSRRFDIVLIDVMLPRLTGFDVSALMRQVDPLTPALLITGFGPQLDKEALLATGNTRV